MQDREEHGSLDNLSNFFHQTIFTGSSQNMASRGILTTSKENSSSLAIEMGEEIEELYLLPKESEDPVDVREWQTQFSKLEMSWVGDVLSKGKYLSLVKNLIEFLDKDLVAAKPCLDLFFHEKKVIDPDFLAKNHTKELSYLYVKLAHWYVNQAEELPLFGLTTEKRVEKCEFLKEANDALLAARNVCFDTKNEILIPKKLIDFSDLHYGSYHFDSIQHLMTQIELKIECFLIADYASYIVPRQFGVMKGKFRADADEKTHQLIKNVIEHCITCGNPKQAASLYAHIIDIQDTGYRESCIGSHTDDKGKSGGFSTPILDRANENIQEAQRTKNFRISSSIWHQAYQELKQLREKLKKELPSIEAFIDKIDKKACEDFQRKQHQKLTNFIKTLWNYCITRFGEPPCRYSIVLLGSTARGEETAYSDIEYAILLDSEDYTKDEYGDTDRYFYYVNTLFQWLIHGLGETQSRIDSRKVGIHLDHCLHPISVWNEENKTIGKENFKSFINTPEKLVETFFKETIEKIEAEKSENFHVWALMNPLYLAGDIKPYQNYLQCLSERMRQSIPELNKVTLGQVYALHYMRRHNECFGKLLAEVKNKKDFNIKESYLNGFKFICSNLAWYYGVLPRSFPITDERNNERELIIEPQGSIFFLRRLSESHYLYPDVAIVWEANFHILQWLRSQLHFFWGEQNDCFPEMLEESATGQWIPHKKELVIQMYLEKMVTQVMKPFYNVLTPRLEQYWKHHQAALPILLKENKEEIDQLSKIEREVLVNALDFPLYTTAEQHQVVLEIIKTSSITRLSTAYIHVNKKELLEILDIPFKEWAPARLTSQATRLTSLLYVDLSGSYDVDYKVIKRVAKNAPYLERLYLNQLECLKSISPPVEFRHLQHLSLQCCPQLKRCELKVPALEILQLRNAFRLETWSVQSTAFLLDMSYSKELTDEQLREYVKGCREGVRQLRLKECPGITFPRTKEKDPKKVFEFSKDLSRGKNLFEAITEGNIDTVEWLLLSRKESVDNSIDGNGNSALLKIVLIENECFEKRISWINQLLIRGANIHYQNIQGENALLLAVKQGNKEIVNYLLKKKARLIINEKTKKEWFSMIEEGHFRTIECFILAGIDVNCRSDKEETALLVSMRSKGNRRQIVKILLEKNVNCRQIDSTGKTVLDYMAERNDIELGMLLSQEILHNYLLETVKEKMDLDSKIQEIEQKIKIFKELKEYHLRAGGEMPDAVRPERKKELNKQEYILRAEKREKNYLNRIRWVLESGVLINKDILDYVSDKNDTELGKMFPRERLENYFIEAAALNLEQINWLLKCGISTYCIDKNGNSVLLAVIKSFSGNENDKLPLVENLLNKGIDISRINATGENALDCASEKNYVRIGRLFSHQELKKYLECAIKESCKDRIEWISKCEESIVLSILECVIEKKEVKKGKLFPKNLLERYLFRATEEQHFKQINWILECGASVNCVDEKTKHTPLLVLIKSQKPNEILKLGMVANFLKKGANVFLRDETAKNVLDYCVEKSYFKIGKLFSSEILNRYLSQAKRDLSFERIEWVSKCMPTIEPKKIGTWSRLEKALQTKTSQNTRLLLKVDQRINEVPEKLEIIGDSLLTNVGITSDDDQEKDQEEIQNTSPNFS